MSGNGACQFLTLTISAGGKRIATVYIDYYLLGKTVIEMVLEGSDFVNENSDKFLFPLFDQFLEERFLSGESLGR